MQALCSARTACGASSLGARSSPSLAGRGSSPGPLSCAAAVAASDRRSREPERGPEPRRLELAEQRDRALAALKELEFDHRTGKVSDEDYRSMVGELRRAAADALRALDSGTPRTDVRDRP